MRSCRVFSATDAHDRHAERVCLRTQAESELEALADALGIFQHQRGMGFVQFLAPTIVFVLGLTVFDKPLLPAQLYAFVAIWIAIVVFVWDLRASRTPTAT